MEVPQGMANTLKWLVVPIVLVLGFAVFHVFLTNHSHQRRLADVGGQTPSIFSAMVQASGVTFMKPDGTINEEKARAFFDNDYRPNETAP